MRVNLLAKRYARSLFDLSLETKIEEKVAADMRLVGSVLAENRELRRVIANPVLNGSKKIKILNRLFGEKLNELSLRFFNLIIRKGREVYLEGICLAFEDIYEDFKNVVGAELITATKSDDKIKKLVVGKLKAITDKDIELKEIVDEDIIGGFVVRLEDYQYDASVATQLRRLRKNYADKLK
ncbi:MAG TPA: ATP synthase F1 subunit delta [Bacteroidetes bacterium]|nr:ATP synthase F1 subunit delta [Bacteroidota bacterium]